MNLITKKINLIIAKLIDKQLFLWGIVFGGLALSIESFWLRMIFVTVSFIVVVAAILTKTKKMNLTIAKLIDKQLFLWGIVFGDFALSIESFWLRMIFVTVSFIVVVAAILTKK